MAQIPVREILERLEFMRNEMQRMQGELHTYHQKMQQTIDRLEHEGLPQEYIQKFREEHLNKLTSYFNGLSEHMERESIPYTNKVIDKTEQLLQSM